MDDAHHSPTAVPGAPGWQLRWSDGPLTTAHDVALLDLDGVVYVGPDAVPGAPGHLAAATAAGMRLAYVTNNAARPPRVVAKHLTELGIPAAEEDVVTSAQAAARLLADQLPMGAPVFVVGGPGLVEALEALGLSPVSSIDEGPRAVVNGYDPELPWRRVSEGAILLGTGLPWVASNTDLAVPTVKGRGPGNGVLVKALADFSGRVPQVAGKPEPALFQETVRRVGGERPLVVGDRLDTDIEGARNAGYASLLVLTGVTGLRELVTAAPGQRPDYVAEDLQGLAAGHPRVYQDGEAAHVGGWSASVRDDELAVTGAGGSGDWWRAVAVASWRHLDLTGRSVGTEGVRPPEVA